MEIGEAVAPPGLPPQSENRKPVACDWQDCMTNHDKKVAYPNNGVLDRSSGFAAAWVGAGLEPWKKYGDGTDSHATLKEYVGETPGAAYATTAAALKHPQYHTQKHHLISINLFKNVAKLTHNATLIGYDVNGVPNGVCLPSYKLDIVRHDLQAHRGSHPNNLYNSKIQPLLEELETRSTGYCKPELTGECEFQKRLLEDLQRLSRKIEGRIKSWQWLLRSDAVNERKEAYDRLEAVKAAHG
jgi:HNH/ENDO VII superfamily nuclease